MIKIPLQDKRFSVPNKSDLSGNIWYTKNIDLTEEGYMKLSSRAVQLLSDSSLDAIFDTDFNIVASIGRHGTSGIHYLVGTEEPFTATLSALSLAMAEDVVSSNPTLTTASRGKWFQNAWHVSSADAVTSKATGGSWTSRITGLTSGVAHPIEVFRNKNSIAVGDGNTVKLYNSSYSLTFTLTLPTDYEVIGLCYSNNKMGVITRLSASAVGQNQETLFFVWDGSSSEANGGYPLGAESIAAICPYRSSFAILPKTGKLLYFNGGGFEELATFPFFSKGRIWSDGSLRGDIMLNDGDLIYINMNGFVSAEGVKGEIILQNFPGGTWCFDPKVGLYHKWSPSISQLYMISVLVAGADTATDTLTADSGVIPETGSPIKMVFSTSDPIGGIKGGKIYYVINVDPTTFRLALTKEDAIAGIAIDITSQAIQTSYFQALVLKDYGQTYFNAAGALATTPDKNVSYDGYSYSFRGFNQVGSVVNYFGMLVSEFKNIGYLVSPKLESNEVEDIIQKTFTKYRPLRDTDSITVKFKIEEIFGIPVTTPFGGQSCTWVSNKVLTFVGDLSEVKSYLEDEEKECEVEIISGSGAGQMSQIASIEESGGTYTITLEDEMEGVSASDTCNIIIDNWTTLGVITSADSRGVKELPTELQSSKSSKLKIILAGVNIAIEELQAINETHLASV